MFRSIRLAIYSFAFTLILASPAFAAGTVGTGTPGSCTEAALDTALTGGGTVDFDCGASPHTITLTGTKNITTATTIDGGDLITLDGDGSVSHFYGTADLTLENITIENGDNSAGYGGAVHMDSGFLQINNSTFQDNTAQVSGAVYSNGTGVGVVGSTFINNSATNNGGVIYLDGGGSYTDSGSTYEQNSADNGGIFYVADGTLGVQEATFTMNSADTDAGIVYVQVGQATLLDSLVTQTTVGSLARVAYVTGAGTLNLTRTVLENNTDTNTFQPMIQVAPSGEVNITRTAMVNNVGAQVDSAGVITITNSTFGENDMPASSGALRLFGGTTEVNNSTIANSTAAGIYAQGTAAVSTINTVITNNGTFDCTGGVAVTSLDGNLDSDGSCGFGEANDLSSTDPLLNALSTVPHDDVTGDTRVYQPQSGSPIIDSGVVDASNPADDQRGAGRPVDGDNDTTAVLDRGAFEVDPSIDIASPVLSEVSPVATPTSNTTPSYTFSSDEAGTITYGGDCSSAATAAVAGNNTITFNTLAVNVYSNCTITVTDASANASTPLAVTSFEVVDPNSSGGSSGGGAGGSVSPPPNNNQNPQPVEYCGGYTDISANDTDCEAIEYVQSIGAMTGNDDGTFAPGEFLQRDQITKISLEAFELFDDQADYCENTNPFPDVTSADWSYQYVCRGKQLGMITGYKAGENAGLFVPANNVMLIEFWALILRNTAEELPLGSSFAGWVNDAWYSGYAKFVADNNLYDGLSPSPTETVPRRDVAVFLYELHQMGVL